MGQGNSRDKDDADDCIPCQGHSSGYANPYEGQSGGTDNNQLIVFAGLAGLFFIISRRNNQKN